MRKIAVILIAFATATAFMIGVGAKSAHAQDSYNEIRNNAHGLCLDAVAGGDGTSGDQVQLWQCNGGAQQLWEAADCSGGQPATCEIVNSAHGLCLDAVAGGDGTNGDKVQLWQCNGGAQQLWFFAVEIESDPAPFTNTAHDLVLDAVAGGDGTSGDKVQLWQDNGGAQQLWTWPGL
jgi:Ricin-type beta-trefoil lectin domain